MKLQLINAPAHFEKSLQTVEKGELGETMYPPLGLLYLASYVRKHHPQTNIKITDGLLEGQTITLEEVKTFKPDLIGISLTTANAAGAFQLSKILKKKYPQVPIILGGIHATALPGESLKASNADFVALGEGEKILAQLIKLAQLDKLDQSRLIPGLAYLVPTGAPLRGAKGDLRREKLVRNPLMPLVKNLDALPFPARDLINLKKYTGWPVGLVRPETSITSTRGCPYNCHFCSNEVWKLQKPWIRLRSPENIMDEVEELRDKYGIKEYFDQSDEINASMEWITLLCREKIKRKISLPWKAMLRADKMTPKLARLLKQSNCWYIHLGIESGNQKTLDGVGKHITLDQVEDCCRMLKAEGLKICGLFMLGNAWEERDSCKFANIRGNPILQYETISDSQNTLRFAKHLISQGLLDNITWSQATPYPGSKLYHTAQKYNLIPKKYQQKWEYWNHSWGFVMELPGVTEKEKFSLKIKGMFLQTYLMLKTGHLPLNSLPFLIKKSLALAKRAGSLIISHNS